LPAPAPSSRPTVLPRPHLVAAPEPRRTVGLFPFVALIGALLVGGLVAVLMLHMFAAQDAFRVTAMQDRLSSLSDQAQSLEQTVDTDASPTTLKQKAKALGMRPSTVSGYKRLKDGRVIAVQTPIYVAPATTKQPKTKPTTTKQTAGKKAATAKAATKPTATTTTAKPKTTAKTATESHHHRVHGAAHQ
jgi:hypothetical protein